MRVNGVVYWLHGDHLGSTSLVTDEDGNVVAEERYYPYGETRWGSGTLPTDFQFTGQRREVSLGIYDYHARWYSPRIGRFLSADTIVPGLGSQALNRYMYVEGRPVVVNDPSGHGGPFEGFTYDGGGAYGGALLLGIWAALVVSQDPIEVRRLFHQIESSLTYHASSPKSQSASGAMASEGGRFGSLDPNDPKYREMFDEIYKEHNQGESHVSRKTLERMIRDIRSRTGAGETRFTGSRGGGADLPDIQTDITSFQGNSSTFDNFERGLRTMLQKKGSQTNNLYVQMNTGFQYDIQNMLDMIMKEWSVPPPDLNSVFLYDAEGNLLASWIAGAL